MKELWLTMSDQNQMRAKNPTGTGSQTAAVGGSMAADLLNIESSVPTFDTVFHCAINDLEDWLLRELGVAKMTSRDDPASHHIASILARVSETPPKSKATILVVRETHSNSDVHVTYAVVGDLIFVNETAFVALTDGGDPVPFLAALVSGLTDYVAMQENRQDAKFQKVTLDFDAGHQSGQNPEGQ